MSRTKFLLFALVLLGTQTTFAIQGAGDLEKKLLESHRELQALEKEVSAQEFLARSSQSGFYPTLNAVGGWAREKGLEVGDNQGPVGYLEGRWNLFRGFRDRSLVSAARADVELKKLELESKKRTLRIELTQVLGQMIYTHHLLEILDEESKLTQSQRQMAAKKVSAGLTGSVDNVEFDLREGEIEIQKRSLNQNHLEAHQKLNALFATEIRDQEITKLEFEESFRPLEKLNVQEAIGFQRAEVLLRRADAEQMQARSDFLPSLDFEYRYGHFTLGEMDQVKFNESRLGVLVTIPLFSGFDTVSRTKSESFKVQAREKNLAQTRLNLSAEIEGLTTKQKTFSELALINDKRLESARKYYDLTLGEYRRGVKNSPDVVTATERWFESQKRKFEIKKELEEIQVRLHGYF